MVFLAAFTPYFVKFDHFVEHDHQHEGQRHQQPGQQGDVAQAKLREAAVVTPQLVIHRGLENLGAQSGKQKSPTISRRGLNRIREKQT